MVECDAGRATDGRARGNADAGRARCPGARRPGSSRNSHPHVEGPWQSAGGETALSCRADRNVLPVSLALAMVGVFGVLAYSVQQRTREVPVSASHLAPARRTLLGLVLGSAARMIGVGVAIGLALAFVFAQSVAAFLFGVTPRDPVTFASVSAVLVLTAMVACAVPALRAVRVDPVEAFRNEQYEVSAFRRTSSLRTRTVSVRLKPDATNE